MIIKLQCWVKNTYIFYFKKADKIGDWQNQVLSVIPLDVHENIEWINWCLVNEFLSKKCQWISFVITGNGRIADETYPKCSWQNCRWIFWMNCYANHWSITGGHVLNIGWRIPLRNQNCFGNSFTNTFHASLEQSIWCY